MGDAYELYKKKRAEAQGAQSGGGSGIAGGLSATGPGGFMRNVGKGIGEIALGVGNIAGALGHDLLWNPAKMGMGAVRGEAPDISYYTDDIIKALPRAVMDDFGERYGSWSQFLKHAYEDPVPLFADALTAGLAGGSVAVRGAATASKAPNVSRDLALIGKGAEGAGVTARAVDKILPGAAQKALTGDPMLPLGGTRKALYGGTGRRVEDVDRAMNPARRFMEEQVIDRALTEPISRTERRLGRIDETTKQGRIDADLLRETIGLAHMEGIKRIDRGFTTSSKMGGGVVSNIRARKLTTGLFGERSTRHMARRDKQLSKYDEQWMRLPKKEFDQMHLRLQVEPPQMPKGAYRLDFDSVRSALKDPGVLDTPKGRAISEALQPHFERLQRLVDEGVDPVEIEMGRRLIEQVAGEPLAVLGKVVDDVVDVMDDVRILNFANEAEYFIERGGSYRTLFERALAPLQMKNRGKWDFDTPEQALALDDALKTAGMKAPVYFPHRIPSRSEFLLSYGMRNMRGKAQPKSHMKSYGVRFKAYLEGQGDAYITDPREAYARSAAEAIKLQEVEGLIDDVARNIGRPVEALDTVGSGERVINLDSYRTRVRAHLRERNIMENALEEGASIEEAVIRGLKATFENIEDDVARHAAQKGNLIAVPKVVADRIEAMSNSRLGGPWARIFFDGPNNVWRNNVLYWRPGFYANNVYGNTTFLALQGGRLSGVIRQLNKKYREAVRKAIPEELLPQVEGGFHSKTLQRSPHFGAAEDTGLGQFLRGLKGTKEARALSKVSEGGQRLNQALENAPRRESFLTAVEKEASARGLKLAGTSFWRSKKRLEQIAELGANPKIAAKALDVMDETMNNYTRLAPWERNYMRRFFMPFWPFYRHMAKTVITMPYKHPAKARLLQVLSEADGEFLQDLREALPDWLSSAFPSGPGQNPGETRFYNPGGSNPFMGIGESPMGQLNPFLSTAIEQGTGRDLFTDRKFSSPDAFTPFGSDQAYDREGNPVTVRPNPVEHFLRQFPMYQLGRDLTSGGRRYSTGETIVNPSGEPTYPIDKLQALLRYLGVSTTDVNVQKEIERRAREREQAQSGLRRR